jgi:hypothetical protein
LDSLGNILFLKDINFLYCTPWFFTQNHPHHVRPQSYSFSFWEWSQFPDHSCLPSPETAFCCSRLCLLLRNTLFSLKKDIGMTPKPSQFTATLKGPSHPELPTDLAEVFGRTARKLVPGYRCFLSFIMPISMSKLQ